MLNEYTKGVNSINVNHLKSIKPDWFDKYNNLLDYSRNRRSEFLRKTLSFLVRSNHVEDGIYETGDSMLLNIGNLH